MGVDSWTNMIDPKGMTLSERSQTEKDLFYIYSILEKPKPWRAHQWSPRPRAEEGVTTKDGRGFLRGDKMLMS